MAATGQDTQKIAQAPSKSSERNAFILLAVFLAPILMTAAVAGYGFLIWMSQIIFGPPTL